MAFFCSPAEHPMTDYSHGKNQKGSKTPPDSPDILSYAEYVFKLILMPYHDSDAIFYRGKRTKHSRVFYTFLMFLAMPSEYPSKSMDFSYAYRPGIWMADVINGNYIRSGEMLEKNQIIPLFGVFLFIPSFLSVIRVCWK